MEEGQTWDSLPAALVEDCAQLTKANSIEGERSTVYTIGGKWLFEKGWMLSEQEDAREGATYGAFNLTFSWINLRCILNSFQDRS